MNPLIVTIIIALGTFIVSIFGASWLNQQAMNKRIDDLKSYLDARFDAVESSVSAEFKSVGAEFKSVGSEFKSVRAEISGVRSEVANLSQRVERIERQLDAIFKPSLPKSGD